MTKELFREDGYLKSCEAEITQVFDNGISVNQTVFYPTGGGQPGDSGTLISASGEKLSITDCYKDRQTGVHLHVLDGTTIPLSAGDKVILELDWQRRHRLMRMHSCMHMLCAALPYPVTGGSIRDGSGRLDFDLSAPPSVEELEVKLNTIIQNDHVMSIRWITEEEIADQPELVKTMSVKPPMGSGKIRLVQFGEADLQACGGTHVANSCEIGNVKIEGIKNKGKRNRRVTVVFAE